MSSPAPSRRHRGRGVSRRTLILGGAGVAVAALVPVGVLVTRPPADAESGIVSSSFASLEAALAATPTGGMLAVDDAHARSTTWTIDKPVTVTFRSTGSITVTTTDTAAITVTSSDVALVDVRLIGTGAERAGAGRGVLVAGRPGAPVSGVRVTGGSITGFSYGGVSLSQATSFSVAGVSIDRVGYAGIMLLSCLDGDVADNVVRTVTQSGGALNSYGIAVTRDTDFDLDTTPRSARVRVTGNTVTGVAKWEGIDTHAGEGIVIDNNTVRQCRVGIAVVPAKAPPAEGEREAGSPPPGGPSSVGQPATEPSEPQPYVYAPLDCVVTNNDVSFSGDGDRGSGIIVKGAGDVVGSDGERATGRVADNTVTGMGGGALDAGMTFYLTSGLEVARNTLIDSRTRAVNLYHSNDELTLTDTVVTGVVASGDSPGAPVSVVDVRAGANTVEIARTVFEPTPASSSDVRGVYAPGAGSTITATRNDWSETSLAVYNRDNAVTRIDDGP